MVVGGPGSQVSGADDVNQYALHFLMAGQL